MVDAVVERRDVPNSESQLRSEELNQIWATLMAERGRTCVVHGRRGVGKAELAEELVRRARAEGGIAVFEGQTPPAGGRSFHPFADIVQQAMVWAEQNQADVLTDGLLEALAPVLSSSVDADTAVAVLDQKLALFDAIRTLLAGVGHAAPFVAVVRDLSHADADTLELASYLSTELFSEQETAPRGALVYLVRDDVDGGVTQDFLQELIVRPEVLSLNLEGLDLEGLKRYVQSPHVLKKLLEASEGLPQEVDALIDALPNNVEELFARKLDSLNPLQQKLLSALAVGGQAASTRYLATVIDEPAKDVARELSALRDERVVERRIESGEFQFTFTRWRDLEVTERSLDDHKRGTLHGGWAKVLSSEGEYAPIALVAHHTLNSVNPADGVHLAVQAAEVHAVSGALHAALQMLEQALPHAESDARLSILNRLAELAPLTGKPQRALRYVEDLKAGLPDDELFLAYLLEAELHNEAGEADLALVALAEARRFAQEGDAATWARIEAITSEAYYLRSDFDSAAHAVDAGLVHSEAKGSEQPARLRLQLLNQRGKVALAQEDARLGVKYFEQTLTAAEQAGLVGDQARALVNMGMAHLTLNETQLAEDRLLQGIERAREANNLRRLAFGYMNLGVLAHQRGEFVRALECYRECRLLFRRLGNRRQLARVSHNLGGLHLVLGDLDGAQAFNDEALRLAERHGIERVGAIATVVEGIIAGHTGNMEHAEARLREGIRRQRKQGRERWLEALVELAEFELNRGELTSATELLTEVGQEMDSYPHGVLAARVRFLNALVAAESGGDDVEAELMACRKMFEELQRPLLLRDAELALGEHALSESRRERARIHLEAAEAIQQGVGAGLDTFLKGTLAKSPAQRRCDQLRARIEGRTPEQAPVKRRPVTTDARRTSQRPVEWVSKYASIIGSSPKLLRVFHILDRIEQSESTVLINGESGTGKELIAEAIHKNSKFSSGPFVKLNCAALVESLLLSELFGHERGSFTGAHQRKIGRFEMAAGGTIFLDEIGDISPKTQVALLRVLQEREFERVGGGKSIKVEARIIFATNRDLAEMVAEGTFREDLYYRLKGLTIDLPPLRDRPGDIAPLAHHFLRQYTAESGGAPKRLTEGALQLLNGYPFPGNIRELENVLRSVALFAAGDTIDERDFDEYRELFQGVSPSSTLPSRPAGGHAASLSEAPTTDLPYVASEPVELDAHEVIEGPLLMKIFDQGIPLSELKKKIQDQAIARALRMTEGNITRAAEMLGMRRPRLSQIINADEELKALSKGVAR